AEEAAAAATKEAEAP
nr:PSI-D2=18.5 kda photosystem I psaD product {N-terminal} [Nicotiana tomentosiformis, leaves, Peptide Chloroplast Partial, 15 aa] [Nicotiana tomentosiformis]